MNSGSRDQQRESLAAGITDKIAIDWTRESERAGDELRALQLIEAVFKAHEVLEDPTREKEAVLFRWGTLDIHALVAQGGFGEVYRAFDPRLQRTVALKLRRDDAPGSARDWIDEARRLARVRHPHVLTVYAAEVHDGRAGIETEFVRGVTLEDWLEANGPAGASEASLIGVDLCRALAAVHRAGLVHGDVKSTNVMREDGGRLVLMDFGSAHDVGAAKSGTPAYAAPELLAGEATSVRSDVYALGALLYRLVSGSDPHPSNSREELDRRHRTEEIVPLRSLRPDLPAAFVDAVSAALATDPGDRPADVAALERRLQERLEPPRRLRSTAIVTIATAVLLSLVLLWPHGRGEMPQFVEVDRSEFVRVVGGLDRPLPAHASLRSGEHLAYHFAAPEELHVYVLNEDAHGETNLLFPGPHADGTNPLEAGRVHRLPGVRDGRSIDWVVTSDGETETFLVVAGREPVVWLEAELSRMRLASPDRVPSGELQRELVVRGRRGVGGMAVTPESGPGETGVLARLATVLRDSAEESGVWVQLQRIGPSH